MRSSVNVAMPLRPLLWTTQRLGTCWHLWVRGASLASRYQCFGELLSCVLKRGEGWKIISYLWKLLETLVLTLNTAFWHILAYFDHEHLSVVIRPRMWPRKRRCCITWHPAIQSGRSWINWPWPLLSSGDQGSLGWYVVWWCMMMCLAKWCETSWHLRHLRHLRTLGSQHCCPILPSPNLEIWMPRTSKDIPEFWERPQEARRKCRDFLSLLHAWSCGRGTTPGEVPEGPGEVWSRLGRDVVSTMFSGYHVCRDKAILLCEFAASRPAHTTYRDLQDAHAFPFHIMDLKLPDFLAYKPH